MVHYPPQIASQAIPPIESLESNKCWIMSQTISWSTFLLLVASCFTLGTRSLYAEDGEAFFESRIRPLLLKHCHECHGEKKQEGGLRLDSRAAWQAGGENGLVIQIGAPESSRLIEAVRYANTDLQMPPTKKLSDSELSNLEAWIKMGAPDPREVKTPNVSLEGRPLWSLQPIAIVHPPPLPENNWSQQPIDCFILEKQRAAGLEPSNLADRRTLIRRATLDLTGLPPSPAEVESFVHDTSTNAYSRLIERLLASPQYGEQWARHWLDVARYSDTKGYVYAREENRWVHASAYRDWVVRSFNEDLAYDRFVRLQIAADEIVPAVSPDLAAMGFLTLGRRFLGVTHDIIDDRIDVVTRGMLGLSVACARCHDHKYDPIPTRDYYSLYGVFQSSAESLVSCGQSNDTAFDEELGKRETKRRETMSKRREEQSMRVRPKIEQYLLAQLELEKYPEEVFNQVVAPEDINPFVVRKWQSFLSKDRQSPDPIFAKWHAIVMKKRVVMEKRVVNEKEQRLLQNQVASEYAVAFANIEKRWRELIAANPETTAFPDTNDERLRRVLYGIESPCHVPDEHITNIEAYFPSNVIVELWKLQGEVDRWLMESASSPTYATILVDRPITSSPRVFLRGNPMTKGSEVPRHFLTALGGEEAKPFGRGSGRLDLANAIASPLNPLTARVMINRIWMHHFGRGFVDTPSDFGNRAEIPSHPELFDWLVKRFIDSGWSIKSLHRTIMLSSTYQQGNDSELQQIDPENRLLARMMARRLSFEQARDAWLTTSGELDLRVGGKSKPLFDTKNTRRTLYAIVDRENVPPVLRMFDFANPDLSIAKRTETSVPQQALFVMNHPFIANRAKQLTATFGESDQVERVEWLYASLYQRRPTGHELQLAIDFINFEDASLKIVRSPSQWTYGYGEFDSETGRVATFTPLPHFTGKAWQGSDRYPDAKLGWLQLSPIGGHPGNNLKHAIVRRWTATLNGNYAIHSKISHEPEMGDGIRAFVSHGTRGLLRSATLHHSADQIDVNSIAMMKGDTLDFIVDIRDGLNSDQFLWSPKISLADSTGTGSDTVNQVSDAETDFARDSNSHLDRWQQLAQVLMLANEFMFVD